MPLIASARLYLPLLVSICLYLSLLTSARLLHQVRADDTDTEPGTSSDDSEPHHDYEPHHAEVHEEGLELAAIPRSPLLPRP